MKFRWRILFFALGIGGIVLMAWQNKWFRETDWSLFRPEIAWLLISIFAVWIVIYFLHAISYKLILCEDSKKVKMHSMLRICVAGFALNNVTPAGLVGGEPYRIMALKRYVPVERAASSTLTFSIMYAVGHFLLWITGILMFALYIWIGIGYGAPLWVSILLGVSGGILLLLVLAFFIFKKMGFAYPAMRLLAKIPLLKKKLAPYVEKHKDSYIEIDDNIRAFRNKTWRFIAVLLLQYSTRLLEALEYFLILFYLVPNGTAVNYFDGLLIMSTASLMGNLLFIMPMQTFSREFGTQMALDVVIGVTAREVIIAPLALIYRFRDLTFIIVGIILVLTGRKYKKDQIKEFVDRSLKDQIELAHELEQEKNQ